VRAGFALAVVIFPSPWPLGDDYPFLSADREGSRARLHGDAEGRLVLSIGAIDGSGPITEHRTRRVKIEGAGRAVLSAVWSPGTALLRLSGLTVPLVDPANDETFVLKTDPTPPASERILPPVDPAAVADEADRFFLETLKDVEAKLAQGSRYALIRAAGLLRQLLLDASPLIHVVNRARRLSFSFVRVGPSELTGVALLAQWFNPDVADFPGAATLSLNLDRFMKSPVLLFEGATANVAGLIKACANAKGGVHLGKATSSDEKTILDWDEAATVLGEEPSLKAIAGTCRVVLRAMRPLVEAIVKPGHGTK
jgi:hypothetical protein